MMTALLAARNILGLGQYDTWKVNTDAEYHEEAAAKPGRPRREGWSPAGSTRPEDSGARAGASPGPKASS